MFENVRADIKRYHLTGWYRSTGFWVTATYRFGHWASNIPNPLARGLLCLVHSVVSVPWWFIKGVHIPKRTRIGPGLSLPHPQNILISPDCELANRCTIYHDVTLGHGPKGGVPKLGNNVVVFAGAKVIGNIQIGDNVEIGANAVVVRDVPAHSVVAAPASRAIPRDIVGPLRESCTPNQVATLPSDSTTAAGRIVPGDADDQPSRAAD